MESKHLIYLAVILDKGSITAASKHLMVAQPTLTRIMSTLEMQAGAQLFTRSRFGVKSTPIGEALAREGRAIMHNMEIAREQISRYQLGLQEELRVATGPLIGLAIMPRIIERLTVENPRLALTITSARPNLALDGLLDGRYDAVIAPAPHDRTLPDIDRRVIIEDRIGIYCGASHPLAEKEEVGVSDLDSCDWLSMGMASTFERQVLDLLMSAGVKNIRTKIVFLNEATITIKILSAGKHLAVLPDFPLQAIRDEFPLVKLNVELEDDIDAARRNIYLWSRDGVQDKPAYRAFSQTVDEVLMTFDQP